MNLNDELGTQKRNLLVSLNRSRFCGARSEVRRLKNLCSQGNTLEEKLENTDAELLGNRVAGGDPHELGEKGEAFRNRNE